MVFDFNKIIHGYLIDFNLYNGNLYFFYITPLLSTEVEKYSSGGGVIRVNMVHVVIVALVMKCNVWKLIYILFLVRVCFFYIQDVSKGLE